MTAGVRDTALAAGINDTQAVAMVQRLVRAAIDDASWPPSLAGIAIDVLSHPSRILGGRLTPWTLMPLCCCAAAGGDWQPAVPAAAASELYIVALDIFDDIEDGDLSGQVERYGVPVALNLATALLALAHGVLNASGGTAPDADNMAVRTAQDALWTGLAMATGGQHLDLSSAGGEPLSVEACLDIARRKGGALAEACCRAGAAFGADDPRLIDLFGTMGRSLGLYGQLDNDMHDAGFGTGKSDMARLKQTVPIAVARTLGGSDALGDAVWHGGIQLAYALVHAELERATEAMEQAARACPDPAAARHILERLVARSPQPALELSP